MPLYTPITDVPGPVPAPAPVPAPTPSGPAPGALSPAILGLICAALSFPALFTTQNGNLFASFALLVAAWIYFVLAARRIADRTVRTAVFPLALLSGLTLFGFGFAGPFGVAVLLAMIALIWLSVVGTLALLGAAYAAITRASRARASRRRDADGCRRSDPT